MSGELNFPRDEDEQPSFPFMTIARGTGLDYGSILRTAEWVRRGGDMSIEITVILDDPIAGPLVSRFAEQG